MKYFHPLHNQHPSVDKNPCILKFTGILLTIFMLFALVSCKEPSKPSSQNTDFSKKSTETSDHIDSSHADSDRTAGEMNIHFLDVGQGLSILVESNEEVLLYDGGDRSHSSFVVSYLKKQQIETIDYLIASHYDEDHVSGLIGCLNAFEVKHVIGADYVHDSSLYESFVSAVEQKGLTILHPMVGTEFSYGSGSFTILSPKTIGNDSNNNSVAIKLTNNAHSFLFMGDAEHQSEADILDSDIDLACSVLCLGHHGSASSTSWDFLEASVPEYAVISCGIDNKYHHPDKDTMDKLLAMEIPVFRTDMQGTILVTSDGTSLHWSLAPCNDYSPGDDDDTGTLPNLTPPEIQDSAGGSDSTDIPAEDTPVDTIADEAASQEMVWISATGSKFHAQPDCGQMNPDTARQLSRTEALTLGYEACKKCY